MTRLLVVGDVVDDIVVRPLGSVNTASDTDAEIRRTAGGSAANVAAWLGHLGADVRFVGRAGAEGAARHRDALAAYGVEARVSADPEAETATIVLNLDPAGERTMFVDRAANARLSLDDLPTGVLDGVGWLHLTGYSFFDDAVRAVVLDLVARARAAGCGLSVDPSSAGFLARAGAEPFLGWVAGADVLLPNLLEGRFLTGLEDPDEVAGALAKRFPAVVLTLGADGASLTTDGASTRVDPVPASVVDTTGAGDAFAAGFLSVWTADRDAFLGWVAGADVLLPNLLEGRFLTGLDGPHQVAAALAERFPAVVLTLGAAGAALTTDGTSTRVDPVPASVVDTTGAGDAFAAGFLSVWTEDCDPAAALAEGARASAQAIGVLGARPAR